LATTTWNLPFNYRLLTPNYFHVLRQSQQRASLLLRDQQQQAGPRRLPQTANDVAPQPIIGHSFDETNKKDTDFLSTS